MPVPSVPIFVYVLVVAIAALASRTAYLVAHDPGPPVVADDESTETEEPLDSDADAPVDEQDALPDAPVQSLEQERMDSAPASAS